jgi:hypothetical protein
MSRLQAALDEYLAVHRALGYKLRLPGRLLQRFVDFADRQRAAYITSELALAWATQPAAAQPAQWANRLGMVRRFALYCSANDPRTTVPPQGLLPHRYHRPAPYLYRDQGITRLLDGRAPAPPQVCALIPAPRSSACTLPPDYGPTSHCDSIATTPISSTGC